MSTKFCFLVLALAIAVVFAQEKENPFIKEVSDCYTKTKPDDAKFDACLLEFWERNKAKVVAGIPDLKVPVLDPMTIDNIVFNEKGSVVDVAATFSNVVVKGVAGHQGKKATMDRTAKTLTLTIFFPVLHVTGNYDVKGTILLTPVDGKGPFTLNMTDINAVATSHFVNEAGHMKINKLDVDFTIGNMRFDLQGLLSQDTVGEAIINMLNDNHQEILADIKPKVSQQLGDAILKVLSGPFLAIPAEAIGL